MNWRSLLWPLSLIYGSIAALRNLAYKGGLFKSQSFDIPVISVGNLSTGGTGKTPMVEYLIRELKEYKIGMVSRGYGRKTKGLIEASLHSKADEIGDEPLQIKLKFPEAQIVLSEKRIEGINKLLQEAAPDIILLDDAFQHRSVIAGFQVLLTTFQKPYYKDLILPAGDLRESRLGKKRADIIVVTKCPADLGIGDAEHIRRKLRPNTGQTVYFTTIDYGNPVNGKKEILSPNSEIIALTGIARYGTFLNYAHDNFEVKKHLCFKDHHNYSPSEIQKITKLLASHPSQNILTTEKDWMRLKSLLDEKWQHRIYHQPIKVRVLFDSGKRLLEEINDFINKIQQRKA